ncbi:hypothetical protein [Paraburkholderia rhizosphaerae]|uniref:Uncharacterized protein n=1 Tax=Paraburkholderia rhizosphaerae TaxID=480658 RepID=A0A4R8LGN1_9BURK|nr:hypothetical protein [Paraburkholderia rhizosphaerae]TDY42316.1 hypothetical protein BX592_122125 [Paraburkholderia rhizosphaerae]
MKLNSSNRLLAFCRFSIVFVVLLVCCGNITNSVLLKWGFRDDQPIDRYEHTFGLVGMMEGAAPKPYVYRSSVPKAARWIAEQVNPDLQQKLFKSITRYDSLHHAYFSGVPDRFWTPVNAIAYHLVYFGVTLAMALTLLIVYRLARSHGLRFGQALGFLTAFALVYPLTFQKGGYYYDFFEILGAFSVVYFFLKRRLLFCTLLVAVFSLNKETFFLVPAALFFLFEPEVPLRKRFAWLAIQLIICAITRHLIMSGYAGNEGGFVDLHGVHNLLYWLNPLSYIGFYNMVAKGVLTPSLQNPLIAVPAAVFSYHAWRRSPVLHRRYFLAAALPIAVLCACFGFEDESRDAALVFPAAVLIALSGASRFGDIFERSNGSEPVELKRQRESARVKTPESIAESA